MFNFFSHFVNNLKLNIFTDGLEKYGNVQMGSFNSILCNFNKEISKFNSAVFFTD